MGSVFGNVLSAPKTYHPKENCVQVKEGETVIKRTTNGLSNKVIR